ncbi:hypothetical protein BAUCODRAFT_36268 [Baudoinia panamericana UAMH 10762]|uniref:Alpha-methylacyl-CoA racemase n=1 Tax=Baudoinia panamericana (strain UAMH 10762) TaxID=717646 RepID=M2LI02_BAUPA|nr:uncharacterized protein BAUCODRAFT_36268 [Baudoinia panamericana UAMH 10762]EMC93812.1 hypothetical protein BAUCODRAFT_36268 [Baudoinia panamericana UAMH 10762]
MAQSPPLQGVRVLEFAGLAPGPFAGLLLADYGATVLRVDRAHPQAHTSNPPPPTSDQLTRRKASICVNTKSPSGIALIKSLIPHVDVVIDPFRPGVLEKMGLDPEGVLLQLNPRIIVARMTGFRRDGKYKDMAGHDINYIAVSGVLSMLGRQHEKPYPPGNVVGDFAGGGAVCFMGVLLALLQRERTGLGQVVEANMVDGSAFMASMPRFGTKTPFWSGQRGTNILDGGCPYYDTYKTKDGKYMAVGALEPQFFTAMLKGLSIDPKDLGGDRTDSSTWQKQRELYTVRFNEKTRAEWESVFDGTDACCTPVLTQRELEASSFDQRPVVTLKRSPGLAIHQSRSEGRPLSRGQGGGVEGSGWDSKGLRPGVGGESVLAGWVGWKRGAQYTIQNGGLEYVEFVSRAKL